ncbi:MAG: PQQ-binding-like beta-propeller repeat protein [Planctomycetota bacterium]
MRPTLAALGAILVLASLAAAQDWPNYGGNAARNGRSPTIGPQAAVLLWSNADDYSIIAWHPFVEGERVFAVREAGFPTDGGAANDAILAYDLDTGVELWRVTLPWGGSTATEWIAWIGGVQGGLLFASRGSHGKPGPLYALDVADGGIVWTSMAVTQAWAHDGIVFAPDGDPIVGDFQSLTRIDAGDGSTVWSVPRTCSVSGNCGGAATATAVFYDEVAPGGQIIAKCDIADGSLLYSSSVMAGFTAQNSPFLAADGGTAFFSRSQNNPPYDKLFAFQDTGAALVEIWNAPVRWTTSHEHGVGADGSIYTFNPGDELVRLDPATGAVTANAGILSPLGSPNLSPKTAVDALGTVYVSNGWASSPASDGRLWAFTGDLSQDLYTLFLDRQNAGGPALGRRGTLVVADRAAVRAYRTDTAAAAAFRNAGGNPASYAATPPVLASTFSGTVDLGGTTGHALAWLVGFGTPLSLTLGGGQVLLVDVADPGGELLGLPAIAGPVAVANLLVPADYSLCGSALSTQALHFGGGSPFALSNAQDLRVGSY